MNNDYNFIAMVLKEVDIQEETNRLNTTRFPEGSEN